MKNQEPNYQAYNSEMKQEAIKIRAQEDELKLLKLNNSRELRKKHGIPPKQKATKDEILKMVVHVLETGDKGRETINTIAGLNGKNKQWEDDVTNSGCKKILDSCLAELEKINALILLMKKNKTYSKREIINKNLVVALNKTRKQRQLCLEIQSLKQKISELEQDLKTRLEIKDWKLEAKRLKQEENLSYGRIGQKLGKPKSTVASYLQGII